MKAVFLACIMLTLAEQALACSPRQALTGRYDVDFTKQKAIYNELARDDQLITTITEAYAPICWETKTAGFSTSCDTIIPMCGDLPEVLVKQYPFVVNGSRQRTNEQDATLLQQEVDKIYKKWDERLKSPEPQKLGTAMPVMADPCDGFITCRGENCGCEMTGQGWKQVARSDGHAWAYLLEKNGEYRLCEGVSARGGYEENPCVPFEGGLAAFSSQYPNVNEARP